MKTKNGAIVKEFDLFNVHVIILESGAAHMEGDTKEDLNKANNYLREEGFIEMDALATGDLRKKNNN
jgi:hypothetical protein